MKVTIYHNPKCSKSRDALRFLRDAGIEPTIVLYLDTGWTAALLHDLKAATGLGWQEMLRPDTRAILQDSINKNEDAVIIQHVINYPVLMYLSLRVTSNFLPNPPKQIHFPAISPTKLRFRINHKT